MEKKVNITSTAIEKGIDIAKDFLDKLIIPAIEETGLLLRDHVTMWKFKNQVKMLNKAKLYCEQNNVPLKTISLKLLCPLLDYSALEEDDFLQDKWAILLSNMVDSRQNIENHVFPYVLSQISKNEFLLLNAVHNERKKQVEILKDDLETFIRDRPKIENELTRKIKEVENKIVEDRKVDHAKYTPAFQGLLTEKRQLYLDLNSLKYKESIIINKLTQPAIIPEEELKEFELSNIIRLGLAKEIHDTFANSQTLKIPNYPDENFLTVDLDIDVESNRDCILTELGEFFIEACNEKNKPL